MQAADWIDLYHLFPPQLHANIVVTMQNGNEICLDTIFRCDPTFLLARGRLSGTTDTGRLYCLPYSEMCYVRWEKDVKEEDVRGIFGEVAAAYDHRIRVDDDPSYSSAPPRPTIAPEPAAASSEPAKPGDTPPPSTRQALLEQLRARRAASNPPPKPPS